MIGTENFFSVLVLFVGFYLLCYTDTEVVCEMLVFMALIDNSDEREKFVAVYEKYKTKMFAVAYNVLKDEYSAEDAVHEAFIAVARNISKLKDIDSSETAAYLCRAAKSRALNIYEAKRRESERQSHIDEDFDIPFEEDGFNAIISESEISDIAKCINKLPEKYRTVIVLRYLDEMKPSRIATLLNLNVETVKKRLLRGKALLKEFLEEHK